jgi:hypothetical protein
MGIPLVHFVALYLSFMCANDRDEFILVEETLGEIIAKVVRAPTSIILPEATFAPTRAILYRISPH